MTEKVYDMPISEVARTLDKSDRQVRRYVKERRLKARPVRVDGHIKLMFSREEVVDFREKFLSEGIFTEPPVEIVADTQLVDEDAPADSPVVESVTFEQDGGIRYAINALREQIQSLKEENRDLHYQLEQRSGQVGFLQGKIEMLQEDIKALAPPKMEEEPQTIRRWWWPWG